MAKKKHCYRCRKTEKELGEIFTVLQHAIEGGIPTYTCEECFKKAKKEKTKNEVKRLKQGIENRDKTIQALDEENESLENIRIQFEIDVTELEEKIEFDKKAVAETVRLRNEDTGRLRKELERFSNRLSNFDVSGVVRSMGSTFSSEIRELKASIKQMYAEPRICPMPPEAIETKIPIPIIIIKNEKTGQKQWYDLKGKHLISKEEFEEKYHNIFDEEVEGN